MDERRSGQEGGPSPAVVGQGETEERWHSFTKEEALQRLGASDAGLSSDDARQRLERFGQNRLPAREGPGAVRRFLRQFNDVLIYILLLSAALTAALGEWLNASVIFGVTVINAIIGFLQEGKAEKALAAIRSMLSPTALVVRDGVRQTLPAEELVPGDVVLLSSGDRVPADLRLLHSRNLRIDESVLTGESVPSEKSTNPVRDTAVLGDRSSMAFSGTLVSFGVGTGVVVATGPRSEIGRISTLLTEVESLTTPLLRQMAQFGKWLSLFIVALAAGTFAFGWFLSELTLIELFLAAVSIAVAAIPEGLPAIMTITLAIGVERMAKRHAIVRRLPAVETLGSVSVICTDKTGTLTRNEMTVREVLTATRRYEVSGPGYEPRGGFALEGQEADPAQDPILVEALVAGLLCNDATLQEKDGIWRPNGDPTEAALVSAAMKAGLDPKNENARSPRIDIVPFESEHKYMATLNRSEDGGVVVHLKGAPERVLGMCDLERTPDGDRPIDHERWQKRCDELALGGRRLLAVAVRSESSPKAELSMDSVQSGFTLLAVFGIIDPPRSEVQASVAECQSAGIRVKMITGDHALTAVAIGAELGIGDGQRVLTGRELEELDDEALTRAAVEVDVFARTSPEHKLRLVNALQYRGHVTAMTGDGVNDAPALKRADVGVAMGVKGTEAAKEAAEMVLADDNFASIAHAVEEGRTVYDNLRKAILFLLPTNGGQALVIVTAIAFGMTLPLMPVQVLWVNMVCAVTLALALAFEPAEAGVMTRPPRKPGTPLLTGFTLWRVAFVCVLLVAGTFLQFLWMLETGASEEAARTGAINMLVAGQVVYLFNCRSILGPAISTRALRGIRPAVLSSLALIAIQAAFTYAPPLQVLFGSEGIGVSAWARIGLFSVALFIIVEIEKLVLRRYWGRRHRRRQERGG